jgi:PEGA domain
MRKFSCLLAFLFCAGAIVVAQTPAANSASAAKPLGAAALEDGTPVKLRVGAGINTANVRVGDELELDVAEEIRMGDVSVIPTSSVAKVVVTSENLDAAKSGKAMVSFRYVLLGDGEKVALRPMRERKSGGEKATVISAGEGDVSISNGAEVTAYVNGNLPLDLPKLRLANVPTNEMKIVTTPTNAEVSVDGKVLGNTPFSGRVVRGEHTVTIRMAGFQPWKGTVRVTSEAANVQIALKKQDGLETLPQAAAEPASLGDLARAARAKKTPQDGQKLASDPIELLPGEKRDQGTTAPSATSTNATGPTATAPSATAPTSTAPTTTPQN